MHVLQTEYFADALLLGCFAGVMIRNTRVRSWLARTPTLVLLLGFAWCVYAYTQNFFPLRESVLLSSLLAATSLQPRSILGRLLEWKPLTYVGMLSYSIYIWQQPLTLYGAHSYKTLLVKIALLPILATGSYFLIERPLIRFGRSLE